MLLAVEIKLIAENYRDIKKRIRAPEAAAEQLRRRELHQTDMRQTIRRYGITPDQLFGPDFPDFVRYRNPETGETWSGMGRSAELDSRQGT